MQSTNKYLKIIGNPQISGKAKKYIRKDYKIVKDSIEKFYYVSPEIDLSEEEWADLYGSGYFAKMTDWHKKERKKNLHDRLKRMENKCKHEVSNFLDIGCGEGYALAEAIRNGWKPYGIDISDNLMKGIREDINFKKSDLINAGFQNDFFDLIYVDSVIEHLINPKQYLLEILRILKKGGVVYIGVPNEDSLFNVLKKIYYTFTGKSQIASKLKPFEHPYHVFGFNKKSLQKITENSGFTVLEIRNFASRAEFMKYKITTKGFWIHLLTFPLDILAFIIRKEVYLEVLLTKR